VINSSQGLYLNTGEHKHRINMRRIYTPNIRALSAIRTHDYSVRASEDISCLRPRGYRDRPSSLLGPNILLSTQFSSIPRIKNLVFISFSIDNSEIPRGSRCLAPPPPAEIIIRCCSIKSLLSAIPELQQLPSRKRVLKSVYDSMSKN
jgi:hypothetical protein